MSDFFKREKRSWGGQLSDSRGDWSRHSGEGTKLVGNEKRRIRKRGGYLWVKS